MKRYLVEGGVELKLDTREAVDGYCCTAVARDVLPVGYGDERLRIEVFASTHEEAERAALSQIRTLIDRS